MYSQKVLLALNLKWKLFLHMQLQPKKLVTHHVHLTNVQTTRQYRHAATHVFNACVAMVPRFCTMNVQAGTRAQHKGLKQLQSKKYFHFSCRLHGHVSNQKIQAPIELSQNTLALHRQHAHRLAQPWAEQPLSWWQHHPSDMAHCKQDVLWHRWNIHSKVFPKLLVKSLAIFLVLYTSCPTWYQHWKYMVVVGHPDHGKVVHVPQRFQRFLCCGCHHHISLPVCVSSHSQSNLASLAPNQHQ